MAESADSRRSRSWRRIAGIALVVLGLAATTALAATVTEAPTITGEATVGADLTATGGAWTPSSATADFAWLRCDATGAACVGITGACGTKYTVRASDEGHTLRARLTASENGQAANARESDPTAVVVTKPYSIPPPENTDTCIHVTPTGPGQGTFSSGTQTSPGTTPAPDTTLKFIDPFPTVRISGRFRGKKTTLTRVTVKAPKGTRIQVRCKGHGCPYKRKAVAVRFIRIRSLQRVYRPKSQLEIRVTQPQRIGKYTRLRTRRGKPPLRLDRCLKPGSTKPVKCPTK